jgi:hypothetical protein
MKGLYKLYLTHTALNLKFCVKHLIVIFMIILIERVCVSYAAKFGFAVYRTGKM